MVTASVRGMPGPSFKVTQILIIKVANARLFQKLCRPCPSRLRCCEDSLTEDVYIYLSPMTLTFIQVHNCVSNIAIVCLVLYYQQTMGSNCGRTIDVTHDIEPRPTTTETRVAYDNSTWHAMNTRCINSTKETSSKKDVP